MVLLRLNLSNLCNFSCKYCHVFKLVDNKYPMRVMDYETMDFSIENFIKILKRNDEDSMIMSIYGGEPLINKQNLFKIIEKYNNYEGIKTDWWVNTNGSLLTEDIADFFKKYNIDVHLSVEGFEETHNKNRVDKFGKGTFDRVEKALYLVREKNVKAQLNSFVTPDNVNNLFELVELAKKFNIRRVHIDFFYDTQQRAIPPSIFSRKYFEVYIYGLKNNVSVTGPWADILMKNLKVGSPTYKTPKINVTVDKKFFFFTYPMMEPLELKHLNYDDVMDNYKIAFHKFRMMADKNCRYCFLRESCGGMMISQFQYHTQMDKGWKRICESTKELIKLLKNYSK